MAIQVGPNGEVRRRENSLLWWGVLAVVLTGVAVLFWRVSTGDLEWPQRKDWPQVIGNVVGRSGPGVAGPGGAGGVRGAGGEAGGADQAVKVYGLTLGAPLDLPQCVLPEDGNLMRYSGPMCYWSQKLEIEEGRFRPTGFIVFAQDRMPQFSKLNYLQAAVNDGRLEMLRVFVDARAREQVSEGLRAHYGEPLESGIAAEQKDGGSHWILTPDSRFARWRVGQGGVYYGEKLRDTGFLSNSGMLMFITPDFED